MVGLAYASVPFYDWFCRATGFGGRPQIATSLPQGQTARTVRVRFDANVTGGLPWRFEPEQNEIKVKLGEVVTVNYMVTNLAARETVGQAAYNVAPSTTGSYFQKINCFCFTEQRMAPGEARDGGILRRFLARQGFRARRPRHDHAVLLVLRGARAGKAGCRRRNEQDGQTVKTDMPARQRAGD